MAGYKESSSVTVPVCGGFGAGKYKPYKSQMQDEQQEQYQSGQEVKTDKRVPLTYFEQDLRRLINAYSLENVSNTPDSILAEYLCGCLNAFNIAIEQRERWYGRKVF